VGKWPAVATAKSLAEADSATSSETRDIMLYLAMRWRTLADEDEAKRKPSDNSQAPSRAQPWPSSDGGGNREDRG
jgi:hypothetical protein